MDNIVFCKDRPPTNLIPGENMLKIPDNIGPPTWFQVTRMPMACRKLYKRLS
jgi:hypothetical protein